MDLGIKGRVAMVVGGSRGLGRAIAQEFARNGCKVLIVARDRDQIDKTVRELRGMGSEAAGISGNALDRDAVRQIFVEAREVYGSPDILVYNGSGPPRQYFEDARDEDYQRAIQMLVMGYTYFVHEAWPAMAEKKWGRIVSISTMNVKEPHKEQPLILHNMARLAAVGTAKTLANSLGKHGITVNTIGTGSFLGMDDEPDTGAKARYTEAARKKGRTYDEEVAHRTTLTPVGRLGRPDEMGALAAFLCSDRAGFINGQSVIIDGGRTQPFV